MGWVAERAESGWMTAGGATRKVTHAGGGDNDDAYKVCEAGAG
jgi:hypothetical protein